MDPYYALVIPQTAAPKPADPPGPAPGRPPCPNPIPQPGQPMPPVIELPALPPGVHEHTKLMLVMVPTYGWKLVVIPPRHWEGETDTAEFETGDAAYEGATADAKTDAPAGTAGKM
jgi:hypothetical protein